MTSSTPDHFVSVVGHYEIDPADAAAFSHIAEESLQRTRQAPGCLYYIVSRDLANPNVFHLAEGWASQADLDRQADSAEFKHMLAQAFKLRVVKREIFVAQSSGRTLVA